MRFVLALVVGCALVSTAVRADEVATTAAIDVIGVGVLEVAADWAIISTNVRIEGKRNKDHLTELESRFQEIRSFVDSLGSQVALLDRAHTEWDCDRNSCSRRGYPYGAAYFTIYLWDISYYEVLLQGLIDHHAMYPFTVRSQCADPSPWVDSTLSLALLDAISQGQKVGIVSGTICGDPIEVRLDVPIPEVMSRIGTRYQELTRDAGGQPPYRVTPAGSIEKRSPRMRVVRCVNVKFALEAPESP